MAKIKWYKDKLKDEYLSEREKVIQKLARGYCVEKNKHKEVDSDLIEAMADELCGKANQ